MSPRRAAAFSKLQIDPSKRLLLCLDGGGMRGILTIQLLKKLESHCGLACHELFDMVAGTSTGGIIAGLIASGRTATEIEKLYIDLVSQVFDPRTMGNRYVNPPAYSKKKYRQLLKEVIGEGKIEDHCKRTDIDLLITAQDLAAGEETFFTCFKQTDGSFYGTYRQVLLRAVMEATMSAPTYFYPLERFVDGGTTTYNNPSMAAYLEALSYSSDKLHAPMYDISQMAIFSFGTGISRQFIRPGEAIDPKGLDLKFWLNWLMAESPQDASAMQVDAFRSPAIGRHVIFRRFQISLDPVSISKLPNTDALDPAKYKSRWLHDLDEETLGSIDMADVSRFDLMKVIGEQMAEYIMNEGGAFTRDLVDDRGKDLLVKKFGDVERIRKQMADAGWLDGFKA